MAGLSDYPVAGVLRAEDFDRARRFYTEVLGLVEGQSAGPGAAMFAAGSGSMVMIYERPGMPAPGNTVLGFAIPAASYDGVVKRSKDMARELLNTYRVLLSRGIKGTYVYCTDPETRLFLETALTIPTEDR